MLSQLSYFPTWTPQRVVARYVCHSPAAVKSFLCTGRPSVRREGPDIRGMQGPGSYESGSGKQEDMLAPVTVRMGMSSCPPLAPVVSRRFLLGMQTGKLQLSRNACGKAWPLRSRPAQQRPARQDTGASPGRVFRPATLTPRRTKPVASPGPLLPPSLKKIGRAAPVGLGYREKKRYRSPLVSL